MNQQIKIKKIVSLTALLSFLVVVLNSIALYIAPQGRVAHWVDWRFLGLTKTQWSDQHILVGLLFLIALCLHIDIAATPDSRIRQIVDQHDMEPADVYEIIKSAADNRPDL
ncbi:hypothetical protein HNR65_001231 [Desulfosalsimonas propionicica]|uniref:Flavinylation-associated cytochrome domain-containing protein n=1 Tax=Desulfosalsimonas propionicica TaxID=332175 RepID=A0A7W0C831_9BACT|nr:DUF4405 domain-containing protein [Desulfosalsimonas propionicica]MBA2880905.1 hypothetical protein [Desulfosalsimonas propionicica]